MILIYMTRSDVFTRKLTITGAEPAGHKPIMVQSVVGS